MQWLKNVYKFIHPKFQNVFLDYHVDAIPRYGYGKPPHQALHKIISSNDSLYADLLSKSLTYKDIFQSIKSNAEEKDQTQPGWNNLFLPGLDIIMLYTIVAINKPKKYVEVGSGNSTKVVYKSKKDNHIDCTIISIDPYPRAEIDQLADTIIRKPFEKIDLSLFSELEAGDLVFIDNSHRILPNSDANVFFLEILPLLKKGVIVHVHDVYLPYDYPQFMCDRFYSEQYGLAYYILANPEKYKVYMPCFYCSENPVLKNIYQPLFDCSVMQNVEQHGGSFYITIAS